MMETDNAGSNNSLSGSAPPSSDAAAADMTSRIPSQQQRESLANYEDEPADPTPPTFTREYSSERAADSASASSAAAPAAAPSGHAAAHPEQPQETTSSSMGRSTSSAKAGGAASSSSAMTSSVEYISRDEVAKREEDTGELIFRVIRNDGIPQHMIWLTQAKNIFATQLPKMPREYIARLVFDRKHRTLLAVKRDKVVGGICFRPFVPQRFAEIAFCAITSSEQVKGYGTRLMNHLKEAAKLDSVSFFLTYADNYAIGYFKKQGFTKSISMPPERWVGYIKDYDGGTLMECGFLSSVNYLDVPGMVRAQRQRVLELIAGREQATRVYPGIDVPALFTRLALETAAAGDPTAPAEAAPAVASLQAVVAVIPGISDAGWNPSRVLGSVATVDKDKLKKTLTAFLDALENHDDSWPFREPVNLEIVPDYTDVVKKPMDLSLIRKLLGDGNYRSLEHMAQDVSLVLENCRAYNRPDTEYVACANKLQAFYTARLRAVQASGPEAV